MQTHHEIKILPHNPKEIFDLVMDVEKYPEFLPWCLASKITNKIDQDHFEADLVISFKGISQKYSSSVKAINPENENLEIDVRAIKGPFKNLTNIWKFKPHKNGCEVEFFIDFTFNSIILNKLIGMVFDRATKKMINAFEERAKNIYK